MFFLRLLAGLAATLCAAFPVSAVTAPSFEADVRPHLETYCYKCHGSEKPKAGINLTVFTNAASIHREPKTWESVLQQLNENLMPPKDKPRPSPEERLVLIESVRHLLENPDPALVPKDPGHKLIHRLSRSEYNNTVRDLLGVDFRPADTFPVDGGGGGGFDNNASTLFIPPILMERYLDAADEILARVKPERIFVAQPGFFTSKRSTAQKIAEHFGMRAFRRPIEKGEVERLLAIYDGAIGNKEPYEQSVKKMLKVILISPHFLFRIESDRNSTGPHRITDYELASRLSYFLWASMPDEELFKLAAENRLSAPSVLEKQVNRMMHDPKARTFSENFVSQWLRVRELYTSAQPDPNKFPEFSPKLRDAMYQEPIEFFHSILSENRSLLQLLDADYTFVNEDLAKIYGIEGVKGDALRRVKLDKGGRGGILTMGSTLAVTSYPLRTSPVLRGKWVLEEILGTPPPPPPPLVDALPPDDRVVNDLTFRKRLEKHRREPNCASCHNRLDPLGFSLENFDPIGRWRAEVRGVPVDASGELPTGEKFTGPSELKQVLLAKKQQFIRNVTEKMLAYALGRGVEYYDYPTVKGIMETLAKNNYSSMTLISEIAKSYPFQYRRDDPVKLTRN